ncbi:hypothetical protein [Hymenobacter antarcticus]|uniref:HNH endonuclease n=1 Tax=Hymenobacter antarcticus TaxID=486270 RepID=A0ABP7PRK3_9BACT
MNCLLCNQREANATGSHIISHLVLEDMSNGGSVRGRDKEQNFRITGTGSQAYFGRQVLPETIEETMGRELDETDATQNFYVADNIFCTVCEKRLGVFESLYKQKVVPTLASGNTLTEHQQALAYGFWLSTLYRCAITGFDGYVMAAALQDISGLLVNQLLDDRPAQIEQNCLRVKQLAQHLGPFNLFVGYLPVEADNSNNLVLLPQAGENSRLVAINHYVLLFDYALPQVPTLEQYVGVGFGIQQPGLSIKFFSLAERTTMLRYFQNIAAGRFWQNVAQIFLQAYWQRLRRLPTSAEWRTFQTALTEGDELPTVKYSEQRVQRLLEEHIKRALA